MSAPMKWFPGKEILVCVHLLWPCYSLFYPVDTESVLGGLEACDRCLELQSASP